MLFAAVLGAMAILPRTAAAQPALLSKITAQGRALRTWSKTARVFDSNWSLAQGKSSVQQFSLLRCSAFNVDNDVASGSINEVDWDAARVNTVVLTGNLGSEVEIKEVGRGNTLGKVSLAVKGRNNSTSWFDLEMWGDVAQNARDLERGAKVVIEGRLKEDTWEDRNTGGKRRKIVVVVENVSKVRASSLAAEEEYTAASNNRRGDRGDRSDRGDRQGYGGGGRERRGGDQQQMSFGERKQQAEDRWTSVFNEPDKWFINMYDKKSERAPDFVSKEDKDVALWLDNKFTPAWVKDKLRELENAQE